MESIANNLRDPSWWFTAVFISILIAISAGYAKDRIDRAVGQLSNRKNQWQIRRAEHRKVTIAALAGNEGFLILEMIRSAILILLTTSTWTIFLLSPMWAAINSTMCIAVSADPTCGSSGNYLALLGGTCFGLLSIYLAYATSSRFAVVISGYVAYCEKRGLPKIK